MKIVFEEMLKELWLDLPNGELYSSLKSGEIVTSFQSNPSCYLNSEAIGKILLLLKQKNVKEQEFGLSEDSEGDVKLLIELVMLYLSTYYSALDPSFSEILERKVKILLADSEDFGIVRELSDLLFRFFDLSESEDVDRQEHYLKASVFATIQNMTHWPNLVGCSVVKYGNWLLSQGKETEADLMYDNVILDLSYLADRVDDPNFPQAEKITALWWLKEAYLNRAKIHPEKLEFEEKGELTSKLLTERGVESVLLSCRMGLIVGAYVSESEKLHFVVRDIITSEKGTEEITRDIVHKYGVKTKDVEIYLSAATSHFAEEALEQEGAEIVHDKDGEEVLIMVESFSFKTIERKK